AGVAAQVEHPLAGAAVREPFAVVALVGEEAGLVRAGRVGTEADAVLGDDRRLGTGGFAAAERLLLVDGLVGRGMEATAGDLPAQRCESHSRLSRWSAKKPVLYAPAGSARKRTPCSVMTAGSVPAVSRKSNDSCFCTCSSARAWKRQPGNCARRASWIHSRWRN